MSMPNQHRLTRVTAKSAHGWDWSADALGWGHDGPFGTAHGGHAPDVLVLADVADQTLISAAEPPWICGYQASRSRGIWSPHARDDSSPNATTIGQVLAVVGK
jgi:hypothetical protein